MYNNVIDNSVVFDFLTSAYMIIQLFNYNTQLYSNVCKTMIVHYSNHYFFSNFTG